MNRSIMAGVSALIIGCGGGGSTPSMTTSGAAGATTTSASGAGGSGSGGALPTFDYPMDDVLRMNQLQLKGTHNSYHVPKDDAKMVAALNYTHVPLEQQFASQGVRQIELDVHRNVAKGVFEVYHLYLVDEGTSCRLFTECLGAVKKWSDAHLAHHPIFIQIEPKDSPTNAADAEEYFELLENEVLSVFPRNRVIAPDDVRNGAATLRDGIAKDGWPTLRNARSRVVFFIDNSTALRGFYTHGGKDLDGRLMFVDSNPTDPFAGILLANDPVGDAQRIADSLKAGLMIRTRADGDNIEPFAGDTSKRDAAIASGAQFVSTDYPVAVPGVPMTGAPYVVEIPGGTPSRCNPVNAPMECTSLDIEDPKFFDAP